MGQRLQLQLQLEELLGSDQVYFQPPESVKMEYPAIRYERDRQDTKFADNSPYRHVKKYVVTIIDRNPDSLIPDKVRDLPMCLHDRFFVADNLNHDVFNLYF